jgi:hypothetical protein
MPQLRSFGSFAQTPSIGSSYVGGAGVRQRAEEAAMQAQTARAQMANQMQMAQMETEAKKQMFQQQVLQRAQELEVESAYKQQMIGLQQLEQDRLSKKLMEDISQNKLQYGLDTRKVDVDAKRVESVARLADQQFEGRRDWYNQMDKLEKEFPESTPQQRYEQTAPKYSVLAELPHGASSGMSGSASAPAAQQLIGPDGNPIDGMLTFQNRDGYYQVLKMGDAEVPVLSGVSGSERLVRWGKQARSAPEVKQYDALEKRVNELQELVDTGKEYAAHRISERKMKAKEALSLGDQSRIDELNKQRGQIVKAQEQMQKLDDIMVARKNLAIAKEAEDKAKKDAKSGRQQIAPTTLPPAGTNAPVALPPSTNAPASLPLDFTPPSTNALSGRAPAVTLNFTPPATNALPGRFTKKPGTNVFIWRGQTGGYRPSQR